MLLRKHFLLKKRNFNNILEYILYILYPLSNSKAEKTKKLTTCEVSLSIRQFFTLLYIFWIVLLHVCRITGVC